MILKVSRVIYQQHLVLTVQTYKLENYHTTNLNDQILNKWSFVSYLKI